MASKTIIGSSVRLWVLIRSSIKEWPRGKIHRRVPHPLERGLQRIWEHDTQARQIAARAYTFY
jgi:hypothetical protein